MNFRKKSRSKKPLVIAVTAVVLIIIILNHWNYKKQINTAVDPKDTKNISFVIKPGTSAKAVALDLEEKNLITSENALYKYIKKEDLGQKINAGRFNLNRSMTPMQIASELVNPTKSEAVFTMQEGLTIKQIDEKLSKEGLAETGEFVSAVEDFSDWSSYPFLNEKAQSKLKYKLEGYIYPDTYFLDKNSFQAKDLIKLGLDNFSKKFTPIQDQVSGRSIQEIITMASIVENEVFGKADRKMVADLLWRRLDSNWMIGADITVIYATGNRDITYQDLQIDSPYNTRKFTGLPPGPVSNPSIESIEAVVNPTPNEYWFYLTTLDTGEVIYAKTNEEHNANKNKHL